MALKLFIFLIILTPFLLTDINVVESIKIKSDVVAPKVSFLNSKMYEINTKNVDKTMSSSEAYIYQDKDELFGTSLALRNANNNSDTISAAYMKRENGIYNFQTDVVLIRDGELELKTDAVQYDLKTGIATNNVNFEFTYKNSHFSGKNLYLNRNEYAISGDSAHIIISEKDLRK